MVSTDRNLVWDSPLWDERSDNALQRRLRRHQTWWRSEVAHLPAGPFKRDAVPPRLVGSTLPVGTDIRVNLMTPESVAAFEHAMAEIGGHPGLINGDRVQRNLLSSQPLAFNLFGHLSASPETLLPWVQEIDPEATEVTQVQLEWAPGKPIAIGGSAFDAIVDYTTSSGAHGFVGVEVKYHENLKATLTKPADPKWAAATTDGWKPGAAEALDVTGLRQFWFNQVLTLRTSQLSDTYDRGRGVVVACAADESARQATEAVAAQLIGPSGLRFASLEHLVTTVKGHDAWRDRFVERYLDLDRSS